MKIRKYTITLILISILPAVFTIPFPPAESSAFSGGDEFYDLLILGVDRRPYQKKGRSDVILIVHCEPKRLTFFSIPRDTRVMVRRRYDKINHAFAYGGVKLSVATIERFLKFKVDNYIAVDFETFLKTIEAIKKITMDGRLIGAENFLASGGNLLTWLRFRGLPTGDRRRCQRHQLFITRVFEYTLDMYIDQPLIFDQCMKTGLKIAETNLTYEHTEQLYETYKNIDLETDVERYVLPGYGKAEYKIVEDEETGEKKRKIKSWYYYPKYNWSLTTYINWYRKNGLTTNYKIVDTLRK